MNPIPYRIALAITSAISLAILVWGIATHHGIRIVIGVGLLTYYTCYYLLTKSLK